jgi:hypothetical protein
LLAPDASRNLYINGKVAAVATILLLTGTVSLIDAISLRQGMLSVLGGAFGFVLYHALFGFTYILPAGPGASRRRWRSGVRRWRRSGASM